MLVYRFLSFSLYRYICIFTNKYIYIYVSLYIYICICIYIYIYMYVRVCIYIYMYTYTPSPQHFSAEQAPGAEIEEGGGRKGGGPVDR